MNGQIDTGINFSCCDAILHANYNAFPILYTFRIFTPSKTKYLVFHRSDDQDGVYSMHKGGTTAAVSFKPGVNTKMILSRYEDFCGPLGNFSTKTEEEFEEIQNYWLKNLQNWGTTI